MLYTNLKHIETETEYTHIINEHENVVIICGRMGLKSIPVYIIAEEIEDEYPHVQFYDMEYDNPESHVVRSLTEVNHFTSIPYIIYYKNGQIVKATSNTQTKQQVKSILNKHFKNITINI